MSATKLGPLPGTPYALVRRIGTGGSGEVFEATHEALGKRVAIELLRPDVHARIRTAGCPNGVLKPA